jgi:hypothetical protein
MRWRLVIAVLLAWLAGGMQATLAQESCAWLSFQAPVVNPQDARDVCTGAQRASQFFAFVGLQLGQPVHVQISDELPLGSARSAAGEYLPQKQQVHLLTYQAFQTFGHWFHTPISREVYRSLATHEVAHAITDAAFTFPQPSVHAREYLAYVALFATMPKALREQVLQALPGPPPGDEARLSLMVYLMDPMFFGVQSYRHYQQLLPGERPGFLQAVFDGKVFVD